MSKRYKTIDINYEKVVEIFNSNGKASAQEFVKNTYGIEFEIFSRKLLKENGYFFNRSSRKYEIKPSGEEQFLSLDDLCKGKEQKPVAKSQENEINNLGLENIIIDLMKDRIIEISKYIYIEQSSKRIVINVQNLQRSGYEVKMI